jgi:hypothetical protein
MDEENKREWNARRRRKRSCSSMTADGAVERTTNISNAIFIPTPFRTLSLKRSRANPLPTDVRPLTTSVNCAKFIRVMLDFTRLCSSYFASSVRMVTLPPKSILVFSWFITFSMPYLLL